MIGRVMSKDLEIEQPPPLLETQELGDAESPTIVLDVTALETVASTLATGNSSDVRTLPEELLGAYYHG